MRSKFPAQLSRNLWETCWTTCSALFLQLFRKSSLRSCHRRVVSDDRIFRVCFHPLQQPGRRLVELSKVPSNSETPLRPRHAVDSTVQVAISTEHLESPNVFHVDTSWTCSHHQLSGLSSSTTCSSFRNQRFLRLSQTVLQNKLPCFHGQTQAPLPCGTR